MLEQQDVDALVVGGGAAGMAAATWLGRYQRTTLLVDDETPRNRAAHRMHGFLSRDPVQPAAFADQVRADLEQYPSVRRHRGRVASLRLAEEGGFHASVDGVRVRARRVVLATGVRDVLPEVTGFDEHYGIDVFHCTSCDGLEARNRSVVVLGAGPVLPAYAAELLDWADQVRLVSPGINEQLTDEQRSECSAHGVEVLDAQPVALAGDPGALEGVELADGRIIPASVIFFSYDHHPGNSLARQLGCSLDDEGRVRVDGFQLTSVAGVYAAGDVTPGMQLVAVAAGTGTVAGVACATSLRGVGTAPPSPPSAPPARHFTPS